MDLNIFIILFFTLFTEGHTLLCYECTSMTGYCVNAVVTCLPEYSCTSEIDVKSNGGTTHKMLKKGCDRPLVCVNIYYNVGVGRSSVQCCNTDLCNTQDDLDSSPNIPNGKQCYYYAEKGKKCTNILNCLGSEDYCITVTSDEELILSSYEEGPFKGCVSESV